MKMPVVMYCLFLSILALLIPSGIVCAEGAQLSTWDCNEVITSQNESQLAQTVLLKEIRKASGECGTEEIILGCKEHFYENDIKVTVYFDSDEAVDIYYTLDGSKPTTKSNKYKKGILLQKGTKDKPNIYTIKIWVTNNKDISKTLTHTYFIGPEVKERYSTYVIALSGNPKDLTDSETGIITPNMASKRGKKYEREVTFDCFD